MSEREAESRHSARKPLLLAAVAIAIVALILLLGHRRRKTSGPMAPSAVPALTEKARRGDIGNYVQALGTVTPVYTVTVFSRVQGQIMSVDYVEGQTVNRGQPLVEIDSRPYVAALLQAQGTLARDQGLLKEAQIDLVRYRKAWKKRAIQKQLLDDQEQIVVQDAGAVKADEGALGAAEANLSYCHIASPIDGRAGLRLIDPGNMIQSNSTTPLLVIAQIQPITVLFNVAEDFLPQIQEQLRHGAAMSVEAYDRTLEKRLASGRFLSLDNQIDTTTGTVKIRAVFDNKDGALFPNQFVNVKLLLNTQHDATLIATQAIQRGTQGPFVYVVGAGDVAQMRPIHVGIVNEDTAAVQGVQPGEEVAVSGFDKLRDGVKVSIGTEHQLAGSRGTGPQP